MQLYPLPPRKTDAMADDRSATGKVAGGSRTRPGCEAAAHPHAA